MITIVFFALGTLLFFGFYLFEAKYYPIQISGDFVYIITILATIILIATLLFILLIYLYYSIFLDIIKEAQNGDISSRIVFFMFVFITMTILALLCLELYELLTKHLSSYLSCEPNYIYFIGIYGCIVYYYLKNNFKTNNLFYNLLIIAVISLTIDIPILLYSKEGYKFLERYIPLYLLNQNINSIVCIIIYSIVVFFFLKDKLILNKTIMIIFIIAICLICIKFFQLIPITLLIILFILVSHKKYQKNEMIYAFCFLFFVYLCTIAMFSYEIIFKSLNIGNINYKYLVLDKKARYVLPKYIRTVDIPNEMVSYNLKDKKTVIYDDGTAIKNVDLNKIKFTEINDKSWDLNTTNLNYKLTVKYKTKNKNKTNQPLEYDNIKAQCLECKTTYI
ncbi:MAG: hypothetical protein KGV58_00290, partial [Campylobacteraceae bacterium]|nr:hypothetical protein [Campylobacteraceae bacterium]